MKNIMSFFTVGSLLLFSSTAFAECETSMQYNELVDCIVVEGSGENYAEWKNEFETEYNDHQRSSQEVVKKQAENFDENSIASLE